MRRADFRVVLDACVLAPANICDLLLSLAEAPRLYLPVWSEDILAKVRRTHLEKLIALYSMEAGVVVAKLVAIAERRKKAPQEVLALLGQSLPAFAIYLANELGWDLPSV